MLQSPYTMSVWHVEECRCTQVRCTPPTNQTGATELYYTMSVWYVEECRCTQVRCNPPTQVIKPSPTEPYYTCQFDMWKNAGIPRSDVPPTNWTQYMWKNADIPRWSCTTPCQFDMWKNADLPRWCNPFGLIEPSPTEPYCTMSV